MFFIIVYVTLQPTSIILPWFDTPKPISYEDFGARSNYLMHG